jgi:hypothetical protein
VRIALVDTARRRRHYSVALLRLGAWRRTLGDECRLYENTLPAIGEADEIWLSTVFNFDMDRALELAREARKRADRVLIGGISASLFPEYFEREGFEVVRGIVPEAEALAPDYGLLGEPPTYAVTQATRGCPRKCDFCMVPILEPTVSVRDRWADDVPEGVSEIIFYDNNILAQPPAQFARLAGEILELTTKRKIRSVDFNQGLDARILTESSADLLAELPIQIVRFAFDGMQEDGHYQRAVRMMAERGTREFRSFVLYNHTGTPREFYYRLRESMDLQEELQSAGYPTRVRSYPMLHHPVVSPDVNRESLGYHWRRSEIEAVRLILTVSTGGAMFVSPNSLEEFEFWWGRDADEFMKLVRFPQLKLLLDRRRGSYRMKRAAARRDQTEGGKDATAKND